MTGPSRRTFLTRLAGAVSLLALSGCDLRPKYSYRYRVKVEVDTPQGVRSGSSVWETTAWEGSGIPDRGIRSRERGEAVAVDLTGGTLFALLRGADMSVDYPSGLVSGHLVKHPAPGTPISKDWLELRRAIARSKPTFELYPDEYPLLVRFRDINDPKSVERVDPTALEMIFGPSVSLKRIVVAVTDDRITTGIVKKIPWLPDFRKKRFNGNRFTQSGELVAVLSAGDFSTELN